MTNIATQNETNRVSWLEHTLKQIPEGSRILDAGAGERQYKKFCSHLQYVAQDFGQYNGEGDGQGLQMGKWDQTGLDIVCDITAIPEPDDSFDAIMCIEVLEHLPDPLKALQEFSRLLKKDGYLIITAPFCSLSHFAPFHYYTGFSHYFYEKHLQSLSFNILDLKKNGNYFTYIAQETDRLSHIIARYSGKRLTKLERFFVDMFSQILCKYSKMDSGSEEVLYFGCHVLAQKV